jgi:hypothetical protein
LGLGVLAAANAVGDMVSSVVVGLLIAANHASLAFAIAGAFGALGLVIVRRHIE